VKPLLAGCKTNAADRLREPEWREGSDGRIRIDGSKVCNFRFRQRSITVVRKPDCSGLSARLPVWRDGQVAPTTMAGNRQGPDSGSFTKQTIVALINAL
jgi:hypothetical protein